MKKQKKVLVPIIVILTILLSSCQVFATDYSSNFLETKFSDEFLEYLELSDEEKANTLMPRTFDIPKTTAVVKNPLKLATMLRSSTISKFSLKDIIPENMVIKNQQQTGSCWTFGSLASLESTLALKDYNMGKTPVVYDFSERHMEYATSQSFLENAVNDKGFARDVGSGGNAYLSIPYLTNGSGAIAETEMPFENNEDDIYISEIQNKTVLTQVNDAVMFPSYDSADNKTEVIQQMKNHIENYGAISVGIHGASIDPNSTVYNNETGAIYCNNEYTHPTNHEVAIIGWDDNYSTENFVEGNRPTNNGAWIIKNSWGTAESYTLEEMKEMIFEILPDQCAQAGWNTASEIPDEVAIELFKEIGYTVENNVATLKIGDNGFMYVSYEDANIYLQMTGIENASSKQYENIYQYDYYGASTCLGYNMSKGYIANIFEKKTSGNEYLTQVAINAPETYTCKVYVNPNGASKSWDDLQQVQLEAGESETFEAGYHTIEFLEPLQITGDSFVVVIEVQGTKSNSILISQEVNTGDYGYSSMWDNVVVESGKSFVSFDENLAEENWMDTSTLYTLSNGAAYSGDTTIKAFTTSAVFESIEITTPPTKTTYIKGENFDETGMVVSAKYANGKKEVITDYSIQNGTNLQTTQTSVTISYKGKTATQAITVRDNVVEGIEIKTKPTKTEYYAGEDFDKTGMVVEATYTDGTTKAVTDYTVEDGNNLKNGQTSVTISYEGKTVTQAITVIANPVVKIEVVSDATKVNYVAGQNFDKTGLVIRATYENGMEKEITDYTIKDGTNLKVGQTTVTIEYEGLTVTQSITVVEKTLTSISVKTMPTKTEYIQNKEELDLTGGVIEILYNDETKEEMSMTSSDVIAEGFSNKEVGTVTVTLTYQSKTTQFDVKIKAQEQPENSNFDNVQGNVTKVQGYYFTDKTKTSYIVLDIELGNIKKSTVNDKLEYYYALSGNSKADIKNWVKIDNIKEENGKLFFEINTLNISNFAEVADAENLYLYIKEVATRNDMSKELITSGISLEMGNADIEIYNDGKIVEVETPGTDSKPGEQPDDTLAPGTIPNAGKSLLIIALAFAVFVIGRIAYLRYKDIQIK